MSTGKHAQKYYRTLDEAAEFLGISPESLTRLVSGGYIKAYQDRGIETRYNPDDLRNLKIDIRQPGAPLKYGPLEPFEQPPSPQSRRALMEKADTAFGAWIDEVAPPSVDPDRGVIP